MLTVQERAFLVEWVFRSGNKYTDTVKEKFSEAFPDSTAPDRDSVRELIKKFKNTGSVGDTERSSSSSSSKPNVLSDETLSNINDKLLDAPSKALRKLAQEISLGSAHLAIMKKRKRKLSKHKGGIENPQPQQPTTHEEIQEPCTTTAAAATLEKDEVSKANSINNSCSNTVNPFVGTLTEK